MRQLWGRGLLLWTVRWVMLWLALSLLLAQSLGQLHAVKHATKYGGLVVAAHAAGQHEAHETQETQETQETNHHDGFLDLLFSSHGNASDCRLYDHLSDGQAGTLILAAPLPIVSPSLLVAIFAGDAIARWSALFDARGPPLAV